jgi:hypothetical protein
VKSHPCKNPLRGVCKREVRIQNTGVRIIARERFLILNSEYWLLNTALAEPTKEVLQAPQKIFYSPIDTHGLFDVK